MRNKCIYTIVVLTLGLFASCSDHLDESGAAGKSRKVVFRLSVSDANVGSRALWSENYDSSDAEGIENYINPNTLQVVVYEGTNFVGKATNVLSWPGTGGAEYQFVGDLSHLNLVTGKSYHIMVLANCADMASTTQLSRMPYDISDLQNGIPMWGVRRLNLTDAEIQDIETVDLLRAAAKIEVALDETKMSDYTLESVSIKPYNTRGYCAPSGFNDNIEKTQALDQEGCYNPHASLAEGASGHEPLALSVINEGKRAIVYVPEYDNKHTSSHAATITVKLNKDSKSYLYEDAIVFYEYNDRGTPINSPENEYNIIRNHHYKFTVTGVSGGLLIKYAVNDWVYNENTNKTDLGTYGYPTYHNPLLPSIPTSSGEVEINNNPTLYYKLDGTGVISEEGAFVAYFQMTAGSQNWIPTLDQAVTDYIVRVYNNNDELIYSNYESDNKSSTSLLIYSNSWYTIKVIALDAEKVNDKVKLGITYKLGAITSSFYLLINGTSATDIRWPSSGDDPKFIEITQINEPSNN